MSAMRKAKMPIFISLFLIFSNFSPITLNALPTFNSAPATIWAHIYAGESSTTDLKTSQFKNSLEGEIRSEWKVEYKNFPENARQAVQYAIDIWSRNFDSKVPINVEASWEPSKSSDILGSARAGYYFNGFPGAPDDDLWYPSALANKLAEKDLDPKQSEILLNINSTSREWYLGTDGKPPTNRYDLASVVLHEIAHGLGFMSNAQYNKDSSLITQPTPFDAYVQLPDGKTFMNFCSKSAELGSAMTNSLVWTGESAIAANNGNKPKLFTPNPFEEGSSIAHLDEQIYDKRNPNTVMTPRMEPGEVFSSPGPIALAMIEDMLRKPPAIVATGVPSPPLNVKAIVGDKYAIISFDAPECRRIDKVQNYQVQINPGGEIRNFKSSPFRITGLKNGIQYTFSVKAENSNGASEPVTSNIIEPQMTPKVIAIDPEAKVTHLVSTNFRGRPTIIYNDTSTNRLRVAIYIGNKWKLSTARKGVQVGEISLCTSGKASKELLHIFYGEFSQKDLIHSTYNGKRWDNEIVDGNGPDIQDYKEVERRKTASDVSVSNACVIKDDTIQVFYRDESQGILLGASKSGDTWNYEIVDGDKTTDDRTTGDTAFDLDARLIGDTVYVIYDSVLTINNSRKATSGEVRIAMRDDTSPASWTYKTIDGPKNGNTVAGYAVTLGLFKGELLASWLSSKTLNMDGPTQLNAIFLDGYESVVSITPNGYGVLSQPLKILEDEIVFGCEKRFCKTDLSKTTLLNSNQDASDIANLIKIGKKYYLPISINEGLNLIKL